MKKTTYIFCAFAMLILSSFSSSLDCEYANSNIGFAKAQINEALQSQDINKARYFTYKALNALEKSKGQLNQCGCTIAKKNMAENLDILVLATKSTTLKGTKTYLDKSIELTDNTLMVLESHDTHNSNYANDKLSINSITTEDKTKVSFNGKTLKLYKTIDVSLEKYRKSLEKVVNTVNCKDAKAFAQRIFNECETQLLKPNLTEGSKYYNLRTKEITQNALAKIGNCGTKK